MCERVRVRERAFVMRGEAGFGSLMVSFFFDDFHDGFSNEGLVGGLVEVD